MAQRMPRKGAGKEARMEDRKAFSLIGTKESGEKQMAMLGSDRYPALAEAAEPLVKTLLSSVCGIGAMAFHLSL